MKLFTILMILGFVVFYVGDNVCLRYASQRAGWPAFWWFAAGNVLGFIATIMLTLALKAQHPNIIFALAQGGGFCLLQLTAFYLFHDPLSRVQWTGVALIAIGIICVQFKAPTPAPTVAAVPPAQTH